MTRKATCNNCRYHASEKGECRILPPEIVTDGQGAIRVLWPTVRPADWCGEWTPDYAQEHEHLGAAA